MQVTEDVHNGEERLRFLKVTDRSRQILRHFSETLQPYLPDILNGFYSHVKSDPNLARMIGNRDEELKGAQGRHWTRLFEAEFDDTYFAGVRRIGLTHNRIGLEPRYYIGGYNYVMSRLYDVIVERYAEHNEFGLAEVLSAVNAAIMLDMDVAISVYQEALIADREAKAERRNQCIAEFDAVINEVISSLTDSGEAMGTTADQLKSTSERMITQSGVVAESSGQASANVQSVAAASEELSASIGEISRQVQQSSTLSREAVSTTGNANEKIDELSRAADQIGIVVELINKIAAQTKLLSLNATIEAARAGDAGKGFGVVAAEVKSLATQTEQATRDIEKQIGAMQAATKGSVDAVDTVGSIITKLDEAFTAIAAAIEEQTSTTDEIARSVQMAAAGTEEVSKRISDVNQAASDTDDAADHVLSAAEDVRGRSGRLRDEVNRFFDSIRAA